jgi:hypothetical protein
MTMKLFIELSMLAGSTLAVLFIADVITLTRNMQNGIDPQTAHALRQLMRYPR